MDFDSNSSELSFCSAQVSYQISCSQGLRKNFDKASHYRNLTNLLFLYTTNNYNIKNILEMIQKQHGYQNQLEK